MIFVLAVVFFVATAESFFTGIVLTGVIFLVLDCSLFATASSTAPLIKASSVSCFFTFFFTTVFLDAVSALAFVFSTVLFVVTESCFFTMAILSAVFIAWFAESVAAAIFIESAIRVALAILSLCSAKARLSKLAGLAVSVSLF